MKVEVLEWLAAVGVGGDRCVERELGAWVDAAPVVEEARAELHDRLVGRLVDQFEQGTGRSASTDVVEVGREFWAPRVEPLVAGVWIELRGPSIAWLTERVSCRTAWRLKRGGLETDTSLVEDYRVFWAAELRVTERADRIRDGVARLYEAHGDTFTSLALDALPGPPIADVPWER